MSLSNRRVCVCVFVCRVLGLEQAWIPAWERTHTGPCHFSQGLGQVIILGNTPSLHTHTPNLPLLEIHRFCRTSPEAFYKTSVFESVWQKERDEWHLWISLTSFCCFITVALRTKADRLWKGRFVHCVYILCVCVCVCVCARSCRVDCLIQRLFIKCHCIPICWRRTVSFSLYTNTHTHTHTNTQGCSFTLSLRVPDIQAFGQDTRLMKRREKKLNYGVSQGSVPGPTDSGFLTGCRTDINKKNHQGHHEMIRTWMQCGMIQFDMIRYWYIMPCIAILNIIYSKFKNSAENTTLCDLIIGRHISLYW